MSSSLKPLNAGHGNNIYQVLQSNIDFHWSIHGAEELEGPPENCDIRSIIPVMKPSTVRPGAMEPIPSDRMAHRHIYPLYTEYQQYFQGYSTITTNIATIEYR